ncbi:MAG: hypothetical protein ACUVUR_05535 [bacterium]
MMRQKVKGQSSRMPVINLIFNLCGVVLFLMSIGYARADALGADSVIPSYQIVENGPVRVEYRIRKSPAQLTIGDQVQMQLIVKHPKGITVSPPFNPEPDRFVITSEKHKTVYQQGDTLLEVYDLTLAVFVVGDVKLAPFLVSYQEGERLLATGSDSIPLSVKSLVSDKMQDINDLKPQTSFPNLLPLWIMLGIITLSTGAFFAYRFIRRYRQQAVAFQPQLPPWEEALAALDGVPVAELVGKGQFKRLYYIVSEIIKRYLTRRFGFLAVDQTTTEIVRELKVRKIPEVEYFSAFFYNADLVKYAKFVPAQPARVVESARELIHRTRPQESVAPAIGSGGR